MRRARVRAAVVCVSVATLTQAERVTRATEASLGIPIQHAEQSAYQHVVVTRGK